MSDYWKNYSVACAVLLTALISIAALADLPDPSMRMQKSLPQNQRLVSPAPITLLEFPAESPCFPIADVVLQGDNRRIREVVERVRQQAVGKCLGTRGIHLLMTEMQNRLIEAGLITARVLAPTQDLTEGALHLEIVAGSVADIRFVETSRTDVNLDTTFPLTRHHLLDLRDLERSIGVNRDE